MRTLDPKFELRGSKCVVGGGPEGEGGQSAFLMENTRDEGEKRWPYDPRHLNNISPNDTELYWVPWMRSRSVLVVDMKIQCNPVVWRAFVPELLPPYNEFRHSERTRLKVLEILT